VTPTIAEKLAKAEAERDERVLRIASLEEQLALAESDRRKLEDLWGASAAGMPLALPPLVAALVGVLLANLSLFASFILVLAHWRESFWDGLYLATTFGSLATLRQSSRDGAGGQARVGLRRATIALLVIGVVFAIAGAALPPRTPF